MKAGNLPADDEILRLFQSSPQEAWRLFIDKHADFLFSTLQHMGFNYDQAMDRFVYICEKLCEQDFRRLRGVRYAGDRGDLTPWLQAVIKNLCISWVWSTEGRKRLLKPIAQLPELHRQVFELYFWRGLSPSEIHDRLRLGNRPDLAFVDVLDILETLFQKLSRKKLWRLLSQLARARGPVSLDQPFAGNDSPEDPPDTRPGPEQAHLERELARQLQDSLQQLPPGERLVLQLRYEEGLSIAELGAVLKRDPREVRRSIRESLAVLKARVAPDG